MTAERSGTAATGRVLVLGDDTRGFLATVRGLGRHGIEVHVAPANFRAPALRSRYIHTVHRLPVWSGDGSAWLDAMERLLTQTRFDAVFPCNETSLLPLHQARARFQSLTNVAMPDAEAVRVLFDKHETRVLASSLAIPVARGRLRQDTDTPEVILREYGGKVVVKPRWSYRLNRLHQRGKVRIAEGLDELEAALSRLQIDETLLEAFYAGTGLGVSILAQNGVLRQTFQHHRVREVDGTSYYRVSAAVDPAMEAACAAMARTLRLSGIAMFEFKRAQDGSWILLEVNARPWGSMPLAQALGMDFVYRWYCQLVHGTATDTVPYRTAVYGRNLLPDLRAIFTEAGQQRGVGRRAAHLAGQLWDIRRALFGKEVQDVFARDDMAPAAAEFRQVLGDIGRRARVSLPLHGTFSARRARKVVRRAWQGSGPILFLCQGNICRSPFAAAALRRLVSQPDRVVSTGMLPMPGRPSPPLAVQAATRLGIDLADHRSHSISADDLVGADAIFLFDAVNEAALLDLFPALPMTLVQIGDLTGAGEIADPVDGNAATFDATFRKIMDAVAEMARLAL